MTAAQIVLEEKFVLQSNVPPLQAVGWEGIFGLVCTGVLLVLLYFVRIGGVRVEDTIDGFYQIYNR